MNAAALDWYFDFISPFAYLQWRRLRRDHADVAINPKPVLFAAILNHVGQLGPAEIPQKRRHTYRMVLWQAREHGIAFDMPAAHPFNPLALLRLAWASARQGTPNRYACETIFRHGWKGGAPADDVARLEALTAKLAPARDPASDAVKHDLRAATDAALATDVFGVPTFAVDGRVFWGLDALPLLRAQLEGDTRVDEVWACAASVAQGVRR